MSHGGNKRPMQLEPVVTMSLGSPAGQCRAIPVRLGSGRARAVLASYAADFDVDPYHEMFFFPTDTLKMVLLTVEGEVLWRRDLGKAVVPGMWFCPVFPFDLDGDGVDEIWFVNNLDAKHPLGVSSYCLERLDGLTGRTTGQWPWPNRLSHTETVSNVFRNFILGGQSRGQRVLVTVQGTYGDMHFQAWRPDMSPRWAVTVGRNDPGARGSHMCPVVDLNGDGVDELVWGERCLEMDGGREVFCADRDTYRGHSDIVQPVRCPREGRWYLYTAREDDGAVSPRVALFDDRGRRVWGDVDQGHMDMGWTGRLGDDMAFVSIAIRIGHKTCGPDGRFHRDRSEFVFDTFTGNRLRLPFSVYQTLPVDVNGDGYHELVRGIPGGNGDVLDRHGVVLARTEGTVAMASKFCDLPGEQLLTYRPDGTLRIWADRDAHDCPEAQSRYADPFYQTCQRLSSTGSNLNVLGGI